MKQIILFLIPTLCIAEVTSENRYGDDPNKEEQKEVDSKKVKLEKDKLQILNLRHQQYVLAESNRIIRLQQINDAAESRIKEEQRARENFIATKWHNSMTGKIDGRSWFMLSNAEQREMRKKFYSFYKPVDNN